MRTFATILRLTAIGATLAHPHSVSCSTSVSTQPTPLPASSSTTTLTSTSTSTSTRDASPQLFQDIFSAPTVIKRFQRLLVQGGSLLTGDALRRLIVFDFNGAQPASGALGGAAKATSIETYPFSAGFDIRLTVGFLEPCGINTPHVHPRATEFLVLVQGSSFRFGSVLENGLVGPDENQEIAGVLRPFEGTLFPQGSIHYQFNDGCEKAVFVAALDSNDPGTSSVAQNFFSLDAGVLNATLGYPKTVDGRNFEAFRKAIPAKLAQDVGSCLARCSAQQRGQ